MDDLDFRIAAALGAKAPPESDPLFRIQHMKQREQRKYRERNVLVSAALAVGVVALGVSATLLGGESLEAAAIVAAGLAAALAGLLVVPLIPAALRRFRRR